MTFLAASVMHFARLLRRVGLPVGPSEARSALRLSRLLRAWTGVPMLPYSDNIHWEGSWVSF